jgi:probable F420-dependent oxidoreductase
MRVGISAYDMHASDVVALAAAAEEVGFSSLWLGEHLVLPVNYSSTHPATKEAGQQRHAGPIVAPETRLVDPLIALAVAATATTTLQLGTAIYLLALRHPLVTARAIATVQELSTGRLQLGVGTGWLVEEFEALGVPFDRRVERFDEALAVLRQALAGGAFQHRGEHYVTGRVQVTSERIDVPLIFGGNSERALRRAASMADGWFASGTPPFDDAVRLRDRVLALRLEAGRTEPFRCWVRVPAAAASIMARYEDAGFEEILVWAGDVWPDMCSLGQKRQAIAAAAEALSLPPRHRRSSA